MDYWNSCFREFSNFQHSHLCLLLQRDSSIMSTLLNSENLCIIGKEEESVQLCEINNMNMSTTRVVQCDTHSDRNIIIRQNESTVRASQFVYRCHIYRFGSVRRQIGLSSDREQYTLSTSTVFHNNTQPILRKNGVTRCSFQ